MERDITLDHLPEHILEEIFTFVQENENLRLVCKTFKNIIDNSAQLMKDKWLVINRTISQDSNTFHHHYQKLMFLEIGLVETNWMFDYQHKERIKEIKIKGDEEDAIKSAISMQYILSHFNYLETLHFDLEYSDRPARLTNNIVKLLPNQLSKLDTLQINYADYPNNIMEMFSNIPTIKTLIINDFQDLMFPSKVEWQLEQLLIPSTFEKEYDDDNIKQFLLSQQFSLGKFLFIDSVDFTHFVMRNLLNLEELTLTVEYDHDIDDKFLIRNARLQRLNIVGTTDFINRIEYDNVLETVLNHYNNVKYLSILYNGHSSSLKCPPINTKFEILTHLALRGEQVFPFLNADLPNLKVLVLAHSYTSQYYDYSQISCAILKNVEKLSLDLRKFKDVLTVLQKCLKITELNLEILEWNDNKNDFFISTINEILSIVPKVKCLGINSRILKRQEMTCESILNQLSNRNIKLSVKSRLESIIAEDWGQDYSEYIYVW